MRILSYRGTGVHYIYARLGLATQDTVFLPPAPVFRRGIAPICLRVIAMLPLGWQKELRAAIRVAEKAG